MNIICTGEISKKFRSITAVQSISINVQQGEIYGLLGLNGAGKTTLIRMLLRMIRPDQGVIYLFGKLLTADFNCWNNIGYMVESAFAYPELSVVENLQVYYKLRKLNDPSLISRILSKLKLTRYTHIKAKTLSMGNQQRLGIAKALMHHPQLIILDEPINGLDPEGIVEIRELMQELVAEGATILLSSHILTEISRVATRIAIIHQGKLRKELSSIELSAALTKKLVIDTTDNSGAHEFLRNTCTELDINLQGEIELSDQYAIIHPEEISARLMQNGFKLKKLFVSTEDLEMYFLRNLRN
jgi:ABC-2 type transport system ATP-binding protein